MNGDAMNAAGGQAGPGPGVTFLKQATEAAEQIRKSAASIQDSVGRVHNFLGNVGVKAGSIGPGGDGSKAPNSPDKPESLHDVLAVAMIEVNRARDAMNSLAARCS